MTDTETDEYDTTEQVDKYENAARLHIRSKRGTGTRDEDKVSGELHADSIEALEAKRDQLRETVIATLRELRHTQPDSELLTNDDQRELATELAVLPRRLDRPRRRGRPRTPRPHPIHYLTAHRVS